MKSDRELRFYVSALLMGMMVTLELSACGSGGSGTVTTPGGYTPTFYFPASSPASSTTGGSASYVSATYNVGGTITSVSGVNAGLNITLTGGTSSPYNTGYLPAFSTPATYSFNSAVMNGATWYITVSSPIGQPCTVTNPTGTISSSSVTNADIAC